MNHGIAYETIRRVTIVGGIVDLLLSGLKVSGGIIFQSQVLIADGIHSLSDLLTDAIVLFTARQASFEADREHPYGHGRIQAIGEINSDRPMIQSYDASGVTVSGRLFAESFILMPHDTYPQIWAIEKFQDISTDVLDALFCTPSANSHFSWKAEYH